MERGAGLEIREFDVEQVLDTVVDVSKMQPVLYAIESFEQIYEAAKEAESRGGMSVVGLSIEDRYRSHLTKAYNNCIVVVMGDTTALGEFEQLVLLAILRLGETAYGVSIRRELLSCALRQVSPGALYTTLDRLEQKGLITSEEGTPTPERGGRAKRFYTVTKIGRARLIQAQRSFQRMMSGLGLLGNAHG